MKKQLILTLIMTSLFTQNINSMAFFKKNPSKALFAAVKKADYENVKKALDQGASLDAKDELGRNAFELALENAIMGDKQFFIHGIDEDYAPIAKLLAPYAKNIADAIKLALLPYLGTDGKVSGKTYFGKDTFKEVADFFIELRKLGSDKENIVNN